MPSGESTSKPREELYIRRRSAPRTRVTTRHRVVKTKTKRIRHQTTTSRRALSVPIMIETRSNRGTVCPGVTESRLPDVDMRADHSHDEDPVQVCALLLYPFYMYAYTPHDRTRSYTRAHPGVLHRLYPHVARPKHPSSFPHPPSLPLTPGATETEIQTSLDVISVTSSSETPPPPPPRRSARKSKIHTTQFMAHVLVPSLPPDAQKSDYALVKHRLRRRDRRIAKGKARAGDNSGSS